MKPIQISASILSADAANLEAVTRELEQAQIDMIHYDVMDGVFVPNISFGIPVLAAVTQKTDMFVDTHLMIQDPINYIEQFVQAGSDLVTFHVESDSDVQATIDKIHACGAKAGIVLKPKTNWEDYKQFLSQVEVVLVMTVEPGFGGQSFMWDMLSKIQGLKAYREENHLEYIIEADGGVSDTTAFAVHEAGADLLVVGSYLFKQGNVKLAADTVRSRAMNEE